MFKRIGRSLSTRQTVYALSLVIVLATIVAIVEVIILYYDERDRVRSDLIEQAGSVATGAARAAFHVDPDLASTTLDGLMVFDTLVAAEIISDLGESLAVRQRPIVSSISDPLSRSLFGDVAEYAVRLEIDPGEMAGGSALARAGEYQQVHVGDILVSASPERIGRRFFKQVAAVALPLIAEFMILGAAMTFVFDRKLTRPLMRYANDLASIDPLASDQPRAKVPAGHQDDELGTIVRRTNDLLARIRQQQDALLHREKIAALGSLLAGVAHELNNPLAVVITQTELLAETSENERTRARAAKILAPAQRCARIVRTFLGLVRQRAVHMTDVDVAEMLNEILDVLDYQLSNADIEVSVAVPDRPPVISADRTHLSQAVMNVVINALQAVSGRGGPRRIAINVAEHTDSIVLTISDNGPGVPETLRQQVFEPFFTTKDEGAGTGLGLSYVLSVVQSHDGHVVIKTSNLGGAEIDITLPIQPPATVDAKISAVAVADGPKCTVLVVDDEPTMAASLLEVIEQLGHAGQTATNTGDALAMLARDSFDLVMSDIRMPGRDGIDLYHHVAAHSPHMGERFVFVTGDTLSDRAQDVLDRTGLPCLRKPFQIRDVKQAIDRLGIGQTNA